MKKLILLLATPFIFAGCSDKTPKKVRTIVELTPKLSAEINESITIDEHSVKNDIELKSIKHNSFTVTKGFISTQPTFAKGIAYILDNRGNISAFSTKDKVTLWSKNLAIENVNAKSANYIGGGALFNNGKLYVTNGSRFLITLDANSGNEIVRKEFPDIIRIKPVLLKRSILLIQTIDNQLFAYDTVSSKLLWQHEGAFETLSSGNHTAPIVYNNQVIAYYSSGQVLSLNKETGEILWTIDLNNNLQDISLPGFEASVATCTPIINGNDIYIASSNNKLLKVDLQTGSVIWQSAINDIQSMSLSGNTIFITNNARQAAAISAKNGKVKWEADLDTEKNISKLKPALLFQPFIVKHNGQKTLNIISGDGNLYSFIQEGTSFNRQATVTPILKHIQYIGNTCCSNMYIVAGNKLVLLN